MSQHTIRTLVGDKEDQTIVFGGLSAGGRGAVITIDQIKDLVHPSTTIRGLIDSAGYEVGYFAVLYYRVTIQLVQNLLKVVFQYKVLMLKQNFHKLNDHPVH